VSPRPLTAADVRTGLLFYALSSATIVAAVWFGHRFVQRPPFWDDDGKDFLGALCRYDGNWYLSIVNDGYGYDLSRPSNVAFFPAYPLTVRVVHRLTGCRPELAAVLVSHFFLAATFVLLHAYVRVRSERGANLPAPGLVLLAFAALPTTFFFRLGYTESMFAYWCVLILFGYERGWNPVWLAVVAGAATATRAPGVALGMVVLLALWQRSLSWRGFVVRALPIGLLSAWGLLAFIAYQTVEFDEPLAFAKIQIYWNSYHDQSTSEAIVSLLTLEPIWSTYVPGATRFFAVEDRYNHTPFSLQAANPIYFVVTCGAVAWGCWMRRLTTAEALVAIGLLLIPYLTRAYPNSMGSFGRFCSVVVPAYLIFAEWLRRLSPAVVGLVVFIATVWLVAYSALFGAAWWMI
jgi:hypothetical protein